MYYISIEDVHRIERRQCLPIEYSNYVCIASIHYSNTVRVY